MVPRRPVRVKDKLADRNKLVEQYLPFANYIVRKVSKTISSSVDYEDLLSYAKVGLIEAAERFDPRYKVDFKTFAFYRIRGAVYDGLRTTGWLSRSQFARYQFEEGANQYLRNLVDRKAGTGEQAAGNVDEIYDTIFNLASIYIISMDAAEGLQIKDQKAEDAERSFELGQAKEKVKEVIDRLPEKERELIRLYYYKGMTLDEAGAKLGLSKSWASRIHARALERMAKMLRAMETT
jgi:RNA polymerase sigma factor for flagellar operon FliA